MRQIAHDLTYYLDHNVKVEFCRVCGAEGSNLNNECSGVYIDADCTGKQSGEIEKSIDNTVEL